MLLEFVSVSVLVYMPLLMLIVFVLLVLFFVVFFFSQSAKWNWSWFFFAARSINIWRRIKRFIFLKFMRTAKTCVVYCVVCVFLSSEIVHATSRQIQYFQLTTTYTWFHWLIPVNSFHFIFYRCVFLVFSLYSHLTFVPLQAICAICHHENSKLCDETWCF